jgi:hypothetical protein
VLDRRSSYRLARTRQLIRPTGGTLNTAQPRMSRLRKEVLASRIENSGEIDGAGGVATTAGTGKQPPRGLAVKAPRGLAVGGGRLPHPGTRSETRSLEVETHDLERQLDSLRLQMTMEKERQQSLV